MCAPSLQQETHLSHPLGPNWPSQKTRKCRRLGKSIKFDSFLCSSGHVRTSHVGEIRDGGTNSSDGNEGPEISDRNEEANPYLKKIISFDEMRRARRPEASISRKLLICIPKMMKS